MWKILLQKVMTEQILQKFLAFYETRNFVTVLTRQTFGRFPGPSELRPRAETLPKVNLDDKSKYNLSMHNSKWKLQVSPT
jgi:hypothetical protein